MKPGTCAQCGEEFERRSSQKIFCTPACQKAAREARAPERICEQCGVTFRRVYNGRFCSPKCVAKSSGRQAVRFKPSMKSGCKCGRCEECRLFRAMLADSKIWAAAHGNFECEE